MSFVDVSVWSDDRSHFLALLRNGSLALQRVSPPEVLMMTSALVTDGEVVSLRLNANGTFGIWSSTAPLASSVARQLPTLIGRSYPLLGDAGDDMAPYSLRVSNGGVAALYNSLNRPVWITQRRENLSLGPGEECSLNRTEGCDQQRCALFQNENRLNVARGAETYCNNQYSPLEKFSIRLQTDGNFLLVNMTSNAAVWASGSFIANASGFVMALNDNGSYSVYGGNSTLSWGLRYSSEAVPGRGQRIMYPMNGGVINGPFAMVVRDEGGFEVQNRFGIPSWASVYPAGPLTFTASCTALRNESCRLQCGLFQGIAGDADDRCNSLWSPNRAHVLMLRSDGSLALFRSNGTSPLLPARWATGPRDVTSGTADFYLQVDANGTWSLISGP
ncbi:hypothetical protein HYH03_016981 [Edaphochlamys debaryana]|uniref:Bulb-type lectin domain-containing protein n=1 Tax=Edaphochlamys debaryana TaxID=47281 RepID=A0A836BPP9_9CHLO|nr:hypothetical protein HYH03_016981 [Edaphochlamys debaryana]|eukprot:KAG2484167.1 hypothetical protein HYH03_016981 [Edaphochlamys debaryana]